MIAWCSTCGGLISSTEAAGGTPCTCGRPPAEPSPECPMPHYSQAHVESLQRQLDAANLQIEELKKKADGTYLVCNYHHLPGCICGRKIQELERLNQELQNQVAHVRHIATAFFSGDPDGPLGSILKLTCPKCKGAGAYLESIPGSDEPMPYQCECQQTEKRKVTPQNCGCGISSCMLEFHRADCPLRREA